MEYSMRFQIGRCFVRKDDGDPKLVDFLIDRKGKEITAHLPTGLSDEQLDAVKIVVEGAFELGGRLAARL